MPEHSGNSWKLMEPCGIWRKLMECHGTSRKVIEGCGMFRKVMECSWNSRNRSEEKAMENDGN
jgi:hypothetical protein